VAHGIHHFWESRNKTKSKKVFQGGATAAIKHPTTVCGNFQAISEPVVIPSGMEVEASLPNDNISGTLLYNFSCFPEQMGRERVVITQK
jgi:hypothetical protein